MLKVLKSTIVNPKRQSYRLLLELSDGQRRTIVVYKPSGMIVDAPDRSDLTFWADWWPFYRCWIGEVEASPEERVAYGLEARHDG